MLHAQVCSELFYFVCFRSAHKINQRAILSKKHTDRARYNQ